MKYFNKTAIVGPVAAATAAGNYDKKKTFGENIDAGIDSVKSYASGEQGLIPDALTGGKPTKEAITDAAGNIGSSLKNWWGSGNDSYDSPSESAGLTAGNIAPDPVPNKPDDTIPQAQTTGTSPTPPVAEPGQEDSDATRSRENRANPHNFPRPKTGPTGKEETKTSSLKFFKRASDTEFKQEDPKLTTNVIAGGPGGGKGVRANYSVGGKTDSGLYGNLGGNLTGTTGGADGKPYFGADLEASLGQTVNFKKLKDLKFFGGLNLGVGTNGTYEGGHLGIGKDFKTKSGGTISPYARYNMGDDNYKGPEVGVGFKF